MISSAEQKMQFLYSLRSSGVTNKRVLTAMEIIDRRSYVSDTFADNAYEDTPLPIGCGQTISQPSIVAIMTEALDVQPRDKVLEIGTGSGYQAAILSRLARRIYTIDRHSILVQAARNVFKEQDIPNITTFTADGSRGLPDQAPFDRIIVTAASEDPPSTLLDQLRLGGIMVLPVGQSDSMQRLVKIKKTENGLEYHELRSVRFVPLLEGLGKTSV
ncbi:MAG: protein-L-isoaspartate(D-aspartate) O-methyltransferase [Planktomarina sp.]|mgnify:FL=1|nr:protein-L-isoaspartate(D-aspartate) O-methyltransferase [Planktomarina sp.]MDT2032913.1 protein-L-isoaspartate(D-aspartate) O-methyltransferase [Planktomarina sp.]MDT2039220.1 protein-L-isoaspartate(D-aspartate) O-methyltransferase [Planktomarina sp.]|tara:strand:+ start:179 stop:826 length:648 start_codon:yes stop_codon:yes gene_type:complete